MPFEILLTCNSGMVRLRFAFNCIPQNCLLHLYCIRQYEIFLLIRLWTLVAAGPKDTPLDVVLEKTYDAKTGIGMPDLWENCFLLSFLPWKMKMLQRRWVMQVVRCEKWLNIPRLCYCFFDYWILLYSCMNHLKVRVATLFV